MIVIYSNTMLASQEPKEYESKTGKRVPTLLKQKYQRKESSTRPNGPLDHFTPKFILRGDRDTL